jgi:hypothetical protein
VRPLFDVVAQMTQLDQLLSTEATPKLAACKDY